MAFISSSLRLLFVKASRERGSSYWLDDIADAETFKDGNFILDFLTLTLKNDDERREESN